MRRVVCSKGAGAAVRTRSGFKGSAAFSTLGMSRLQWCQPSPSLPTSTSMRFSSSFSTANASASSTSNIPMDKADANEAGGLADGGVTIQEVSAASFDADVIQSKQAVAVVFYANTPTCNDYVQQCKEITTQMNEGTTHKWLKLALINGDRNANLASAFSVQRTKLPATVFVYAGTIVDRLNGFVASDRCRLVFSKYKSYYEEKANVSLGGGTGAHPIPTATAAHLQDMDTTEKLRQAIRSSLVGRDCISFVRSDIAASVTASDASVTDRDPTVLKQLEAMDLLNLQIAKGKKQSELELAKLRAQIGIDVKKLSEEELMASYYTSPTYLNAAVIAGLEVLQKSRQNAVNKNADQRTVQKELNNLKTKFGRATQYPEFRRVVSLAELLLVRSSVYRLREDSTEGNVSSQSTASIAPSQMSIGTDESDIQLADDFARWLADVDSPEFAVDSDTVVFSSTIFAAMLGRVRSCFLAAKVEAKGKAVQEEGSKKGDELLSARGKAAGTLMSGEGATSAARRLEAMKRFYVAALQCYPETPETRSYRSRLASFLY